MNFGSFDGNPHNEILSTSENEKDFLREIGSPRVMGTPLKNFDFVPTEYQMLFTPVFSLKERRIRHSQVESRLNNNPSEDERVWLERTMIFLEKYTM